MTSALASSHAAPASRSASGGSGDADYPRLLIIDQTLCGNGTATGEIKRVLFKGWPEDRLLQFHTTKFRAVGVGGPKEARGFDPEDLSVEDAVALAGGFAPQVILYRPVPDHAALHAVALAVIARVGVPLVVWMMDDWPSLLAHDGAADSRAKDADLRRLISDATLCLSICDSMSEAFAVRYGKKFKAYANGIEPDAWVFERPARGVGETLVVRYTGSLAENMALESVERIAMAIEELSREGVAITFEIKTTPYWSRIMAPRFARFKQTTLGDALLSEADYRRWMASADVNIIAYNFDPRSLAYVRYSLANKLPECLASGAAVLVHGPAGLPTVDHVQQHFCGVVVAVPDVVQIKSALRSLLSPQERDRWAARGREVALAYHDVRKLRESLRADLAAIAAPANPSETIRALTVPFPPCAEARLDERAVACALLAARGRSADTLVEVAGEGVSCSALRERLAAETAEAVLVVGLLAGETGPAGAGFRDAADTLASRGYAVYASEWGRGRKRGWYRLKLYPCDAADPEARLTLMAFRDDPGGEAVTATVESFLKVRAPSGGSVPRARAGATGRLAVWLRSHRSRTGFWLRTSHPAWYAAVLTAERKVTQLARGPLSVISIGLVLALGLIFALAR